MILDLQTKFSGSTSAAGVTTGQALTVDAISTNVLDLRQAATPASVDESIFGPDMSLIVQVTVAADAADAAKTLIITLESDSTEDLATSATVHITSPTYTGAQLIAGFVAVRSQLPSGNYERYLGVRYNVSATFTAFNVVAFLTPDIQRNITYPAGFTIDV